MKHHIWITASLSLAWIGLTALPVSAASSPGAHDKDAAAEDDDGPLVITVVADDKGHRQVVRTHFELGKRGFLGVHLVALTEELRLHYTKDAKVGVLVGTVEEDSPAAKSGMKVGDVLVSIDGVKLRSGLEVGELVGNKKKGDKARLGIIRNHQSKELIATIEERERGLCDLSGKHCGGELGFDFDFDVLNAEIQKKLQHLPQELQLLPKLKDLPKRLEKLKCFKVDELKFQEKMRKLELRMKELEKRLQGRLQRPKKGEEV